MPAETTTYVILRRIVVPDLAVENPLPDEVHWIEVGEADAATREGAVTSWEETNESLPAGEHEFRAVPKRSWPDETITVSVETKRVVGVKKKEAVHA